MKKHEKSGDVFWILNPGEFLAAGCQETQGKALLLLLDHSKVVPGTENDDESSIAAYRPQYVLSAGSQGPLAGTEGSSSKLFVPALSSLRGFQRIAVAHTK